MEAEGCRRDGTHLWLVRICILAFQPTFLRYVCKWCSMFGSGDQPSTVTSHCTVVQDRLFQRRLFSARVFTPNIKLRHQDPCPQKAGLIPYASHLSPLYALLKLYWGSGGCWSQSCLADVRCRRKRCSGLVQWPDASLLVKENRVEEKHHVWGFFFFESVEICWFLRYTVRVGKYISDYFSVFNLDLMSMQIEFWSWFIIVAAWFMYAAPNFLSWNKKPSWTVF